MKKTYISPDMETIEIKMVGMLAASDPKILTDPIDSGDAESREDFDMDDIFEVTDYDNF